VPGKPVNVQIIPSSEGFEKIVTAKVGGSSPRKKSRDKIHKYNENIFDKNTNGFEVNYGYGGSNRSTLKSRKSRSAAPISISSKTKADGKQVFYISGMLAPNRTYTYNYYIYNPSLAAAGAFKERLTAGGVHVFGGIGVMQIGNSTGSLNKFQLCDFKRPVLDLLIPLNKNSNNYLAENLFKLGGSMSGNRTNNAMGARELLRRQLKKSGIDCNECSLNDGSGLSKRNRVTTSSLVSLLLVLRKNRNFIIFDTSLSIAGVDGTLKKRMHRTLAENNLHGKTGTLANASGLAGYVRTADGDTLVFAFLFNGSSVGVYKKIEDLLAIRLAEFRKQ